MPPKNNKGKKQRESQPEEERPKDQASKAEGKPEPRTEEKATEAAAKPSKSSGKTTDELWDECVSLQQELESVRKQKHIAKQQRDSAQSSWDNSKRKLEEAKERMREKLRLRQEAQKRHKEEIEECEQKIKQLETSNHREICELKVATVARSSKMQEQHEERMSELREKENTLKSERREKERRNQITAEKLKLKQFEEIREIKNSYVDKQKELEAKYTKQMKVMAQEHREKTDKKLVEIDKRMKKSAGTVKRECEEELERAKHGAIAACHHQNEAMQAMRDLEQAQKQDAKLSRRIAAATAEKKRLTEAVSNMDAMLAEKKPKLFLLREAKAKTLKKSNKEKVHIEKEQREVTLKFYQLETKYEQLLQERDQLKKMRTEMMLQAQQESSFKNMLAEKKVEVLSKTLEKEQLKLWVGLAFIKGDQTAAQNIKEVFESKQAVINGLKEDISRDLKECHRLGGKERFSDTTAHKGTSEDEELTSLMEQLVALCIPKDDSGQQDEQGPSPAGAESRP